MTEQNRAPMTPRDRVAEAQHFYFGDVVSEGDSYVSLRFPSMYLAAGWANAMGIGSQVRYIAPEDNLKKHISDPAHVFYEF